MPIKITTSRHSTLTYCQDCQSEHIGRSCGMTAVERYGTLQLDQSWMPAKSKKNYYDSESVDALFGGSTGAEREAQMLDETRGVGTVSEQEMAALQKAGKWKEVEDFYLGHLSPEVDDPFLEEATFNPTGPVEEV